METSKTDKYNCKGCYALGTACNDCERCRKELKKIEAIEAIEFGEWLRTFEILDKMHGYWVLEHQVSTESLYKVYLKDRHKWRKIHGK